MSKQFNYGGQAVIEGVMMRGSHRFAVAVRDPEGGIVLHEEEITSSLYNGVWSKVPFVRGLGLLWDSLGLGTRALIYSADVAMGEEAEFGGAAAFGTVAVSMALGIGLFFLLPAAVADGLHTWLGIESALAGNLIEGVIRLAIVIAYIWAIGQTEDIQRVFQYHGAEHKTINAYEAGAALTPEEAAKYPLEHPRCGTGFLLVVVIVSVLVFALLGRPPLLVRLASRIVLVPVIAGIAYEYIRFLARRLDQSWARIMVQPQLWLQKLTTREPDLSMLEVAITSLQSVLDTEEDEPAAAPVEAV